MHRVILERASPYFKDAFSAGFRETETKTLTCNDPSPQANWRAFEYVYTGSYKDEPTVVEGDGKLAIRKATYQAKLTATWAYLDDDKMKKHLRVWAIGDLWGFEPLKSYAFGKLHRVMQVSWREEIFYHCVEEIYERTHKGHREMRDSAVKIIVDREYSMSETQLELLDKMIWAGGDFALDLARKKRRSY